jgi:hypothetical protein
MERVLFFQIETNMAITLAASGLVVSATRLRLGSPGLTSMGRRSSSEGGKQGTKIAGQSIVAR